ncbi:gamma-glutamyltranspeptidase/glutathione hydrolase [Evansella vedderi]|uniref:Gamma-glutamyltranspeptidase/glutathione hydrolase n=1 Tax=Evansella vedderi TaxID=38282 RepID=A0ABT9ZZY8_9BACI|nr:gamma-glutamyltransferase [Evansella vedderi]MDQ0256434.1 gamma-glutamyltranspeptidase/glutathione hydrolase [Evansella vedderi]
MYNYKRKGNSSNENRKMVGKYSVSAAHPLAVDVGMEIMRKGGNAVDAAIAISFVLGVVEPYGSGIGGGGVMMIYENNGEKPIFYDYRECAPWVAKTSKSKIGIPGLVKGMETIHKDLGTLNWKSLIQPAIHIAKKGFHAHKVLIEQLKIATHIDREELTQFYPHQAPLSQGERIEQPLLAETLSRIAENGSDVFYNGSIGEAICKKVPDLHISDLKNFSIKKREVLQGKFDDFVIYGAPPPVAGTMLIQVLQMAEMIHLDKYSVNSSEFIDRLAQILRTCYAERKIYNADPDFKKVDQAYLCSIDYCKTLVEKTFRRNTSISKKNDSTIQDYNNTTSFVVADSEGRLVSTTNTLSDLFGSGLYVKGFFLNNQMRNFSDYPSVMNNYQPGKKPHSFIAPSILISEKKGNIAIGSSGGKRIPNMLARILIEHVKHGCNLQSATNATRYFIDEKHIYLEGKLPQSVENNLLKSGYSIQHHPVSIFYGGVHSIALHPKNKNICGCADPRRGGKWMVAPSTSDHNMS